MSILLCEHIFFVTNPQIEKKRSIIAPEDGIEKQTIVHLFKIFA